jgi:hypothetical protein
MARKRLQALREKLALVTQTDPNQYGKAFGLTAFFPILEGHEDDLQAHLDGLDPAASPLSGLSQVHMSRLLIIRDLVYQGPPQVPETLDSAYLVFTGSFDGALDPFLRDLAALGAPIDAIFRHTRGFPGTADPAAFATWAATHRRANGYFLSPWPFATVQDVQESLRVQAGFGELVSQSRELDDAELKARFDTLMAGGR